MCNFDIDEAKKQLKTRPDLLSVDEIYKVADSYGEGTDGYREAILTSARIYPDAMRRWWSMRHVWKWSKVMLPER